MKAILLLCLFTFSVKTYSTAQKLHAFLICSTTDPNPTMQQGSQLDYFKMSSFCRKIAKSMSYQYQEYAAINENFSTSQIKKIIADAMPQVTASDIVIFYYSGHGFLLSDQKTIFPALNVPTTSIPSLDLHNTILNKKPRFLFSIVDACSAFKDLDKQNQFIFTAKDESHETPAIMTYSKSSLESLFNKCNHLIVTAAQPGFKAVQTSSGSSFTRSLIEAFEQKFSPNYNGPHTWEDVLRQTQSSTLTRTTYYRYNSYPVWSPQECEQIVPKFELDTLSVKFRFDLTIKTTKGRKNFFSGRQWYRSSITVTSPIAEQIDSVMYYLDATMPSPIKKQTNREQSFKHRISTYGTFPIMARVYFSDGRFEELIRDIKFPDNSSESK